MKDNSFSSFSEEVAKANASDILARGSANVGCQLPQTEYFFGVLEEEILAFIMTIGYKDLTPSEILLAIRLNANPGLKMPSGIDWEFIPFTGKHFNTYFLSQVLSGYMAIRNLLDRKLQNFIDDNGL